MPEDIWQHTQLVYVCSPGNPTGKVMDLAEWRTCSICPTDTASSSPPTNAIRKSTPTRPMPPLGALQAAHQLGGEDYGRLVVFNSLSKRSNVPGMRSGFVAGRRRNHGKIPALPHLPRLRHEPGRAGRQRGGLERRSARDRKPPPVPREIRRRHAHAAGSPRQSKQPDAAFYLWAQDGRCPTRNFARRLYRDYNVTVLPGSFLAREAHGINPGKDFVRIALVAAAGASAWKLRREFRNSLIKPLIRTSGKIMQRTAKHHRRSL